MTSGHEGTRAAVAAVVGLLAVAGPAGAHHSIAAGFDMATTVTVSGTIMKMEWRNPHALLTVDVRDAQGRMQTWSIWFGSANGLYRRGWRPGDLPLGSTVTVSGYHARDGSNQLYGGDTTLPDGRTLFAGDAPAGR